MTLLALEQTTLAGLEPDPSLDDLLVRVWGRLGAREIVECPVCRGEMEPEYRAQTLQPDDPGSARTGDAGPRAGRSREAGRCRDCGAVLS